MKIVFLCGCLEPGHDGVGDYTRRLAAELNHQGHISAAISLNDKHISDKLKEIQHSGGTDLPVLRLPGVWAMKVRLRHAKKYIDDFDPDWLSLQFVVFGFHPKGLPFGLGSQLAFLGLGRRWHIMFHELWLGMEISSSKKHSLWGGIQRRLIKSLINALNPEVIHTHTRLYQRHIAKLGITAGYLPLFGNIPKVYKNGEELNLSVPLKGGKSINMILFGHIHPKAPVEDFAKEAAVYSVKHGVEMNLIIIGRCGNEQGRWADKWAAAGLPVNIFGEQPVKDVSKALATASIGLSTTPFALIEKSGSVAAMYEHGLPVICVPILWEPKNFEDLEIPKGTMLYKKGNLESIFTEGFDQPAMNNVSVIASQLAKALLNIA